MLVPGDGVYSNKTAACSGAILVENAPPRRKYAKKPRKTAAGMEKYLYFMAGFVLYYIGWITIGEFYDGESVV